MKYLFELLIAFFRPGVGGDGDADGGAGDANADKGGDADGDQLDLELDADAGVADKDAGAGDQQVASKEELEAARREAREYKEKSERYEREMAEARLRSQRPAPDEQTSREDAILSDPNASAQDKWKVQADRILRQNTATAQMTMAQAQELHDKTDYASLVSSNPVAKKYEARVEAMLAQERQNGRNPPRRAILKHMLGEDMLEGKFKKKTAPADKSASSTTAVNRGRLPGARSDVGQRSGLTDHQKRVERLRNQQI